MIYIATNKIDDGFPLSTAYDDTIYQKANSDYYLKFRYPVDELGIWKELTCEKLLKADDTRGLQFFKIKKVNKLNGYVRVYAKHISDDINYIGVDTVAVDRATGKRVMTALMSAINEPSDFVFDSDIASMHTLNLSNTTVGKVLSKDKHSIIGQWGGELIRDNFLLDLKSRGGVDTEILFMNKKNVKNLDNVISTEKLITRLRLTAEIDTENHKKQTISATVNSPNINKYPRIYTAYMKVTDKNVTDLDKLVAYGEKYFQNTLVDFPSDNLTVNVIDQNQEQVNLFDTVWFRNVEFGIDKRLKVVAYEYSPMAKRYKKISFGALKLSNLGQVKTLNQLNERIEEAVNESFVDGLKIQENLKELIRLDRTALEEKMQDIAKASESAVEVKKALFEANGEIPEIVKTRILDAVEGNIARLKTIITEAEMIKSIQAQLNFAEIKNAMIDKAFIKTLISDESFRQEFEDGEVNTQNIFTKMRDAIQSSIRKDFITKEETKKLVNDITIGADGIRQIAKEEGEKYFKNKHVELKGLDGKSAYVYKKYSNFEDGRNMTDDPNSSYIGIYTGDKPTAPTEASEYSWTRIKQDGKLYKGYANDLNGLDFTVVEPEDDVPLFAKNKPRVHITNDKDISDIWQANIFLAMKPNTMYTLTARAKGNRRKLWAYFRNNKTMEEYPWGQLEFKNVLETKSITFTTGNEDVDDVLFKFILVPEDEPWDEVMVEWFTIYEGDKRYTEYPTNEPAQYHKYRYFGYVFKDTVPMPSDFDWFDIQQKSITGDKYTHLVYSDNADGSDFGRSPKKYMGIARTTSPVTPTDKNAFKWVRIQGEDGKSSFTFNLLKGTEIKDATSYKLHGTSPTINEDDYTPHNSVEVNNNKLTKNAWKGISFVSTLTEFKRGDKIAIRLPIYIFDDVDVDAGIFLALKSHSNNKQMAGFDLSTNTPRNTWVVKEFIHEVQQDFKALNDNLFFIFSTKNGHFKIAEPYMSLNDTVPKTWYPNVLDLKPESPINLNYLPNSNFVKGLAKWSNEFFGSGLDVVATEVNGVRFTGTPTVDNKGLASEDFIMKVKQGEKFTVSFDYTKNNEEQTELNLVMMFSNGNEKIGQQNVEFRLASEEQRFSHTFTSQFNFNTVSFNLFVMKNQDVDFLINNIKVETGENATAWLPSVDDFKLHSLTATVRFNGTYSNNVITDVKPVVEVYYDGTKVAKDFGLRAKYKGANRNDWSEFTEVTVNQDGVINEILFENGEQNGLPIEIMVLVTYNGLSSMSSERLENKYDAVEIKEIIEKNKKFESTIDNFTSTIKEYREQFIYASRNLIKGSGEMSNIMPVMSNWHKDTSNGTAIFTKLNTNDNEGVYFVLADFLQTEYQDEVLTWSIDIKASKDITFGRMGQGTGGVKTGTFNIAREWQRFSHTFTNKFERDFTFFLEDMAGTCNEGDKIYFKRPKIEKGTIATEWTPAPEDLDLLKQTLETSINQTKDQLGLTVKKNEVISAINLSTEGNEGRVVIDADKVDIKGALRSYKGYIGGFQIGTHEADGQSAWWLTGEDQFYVGMSNGAGKWNQTALWVNWGASWDKINEWAWYVKENGEMHCGNRAHFHETPIVYGDLQVNGDIFYKSGKNYGKWIYSPTYTKIDYSNGYFYIYKYGGSYDWIPLNKEISDRRFKKDIKKSEVNALEKLNKLQTYSYTKEYNEEITDISCGIMAQDIEKVIPDAFKELPDDIKSYGAFEMIPYLVKGIQELSDENKKLHSKLEELSTRLEKLEKR